MRLLQIFGVCALLPLTAFAIEHAGQVQSTNRFQRPSFSRASLVPKNDEAKRLLLLRGGFFSDQEDGGATASVGSSVLVEGGDVRGGFNASHGKNNQQAEKQNPQRASPPVIRSFEVSGRVITLPKDKYLIGSVGGVVVGALLYKYREAFRPFMDKKYIQERTLTILQQLEQNPASIPIYILGMAVWEFLGMSTIPVETAAGMVFGPFKGLIASGMGKLGGAYTAFYLGRTLLAQQVRTKLQQNQVWSVLDKSTDVHSPLVVALLMKFSCFPEFVKNFGCSCLDMSFATFATATAFHGLMFTTLWTLLGVDAAARLETPDLPANVALQVFLVMAALVGLVGSPLLMAWWIRDMKRMLPSQQE